MSKDSGKRRETPMAVKQFFFLLNTIITVNYLIWRVLYTIPIMGRPLSMLTSFTLFVFELFGMIEQFVHFRNMAHVRDYPAPVVPLELYPDIDIFISTYNEEEELLYKTIKACLNLEYPDLNKVHIYVCDDGHRASMKKFAASFGPRIHYFDRDTHEGKKAGNLNAAVARTSSPYIVTLDADMIVQSSFLMEIAPYLVDAELKNRKLPEGGKIPLGFIQTPQSFYDLDLFQFNLFSEASIPNEQDYFYRSIQVAKTKSNSVIYGGSNTFLSRKAINDIGGFYTESITEDFATGCNIQKKGYVCLGTGKPLASGLSPNTINSLVKQRVRWARGCIDTGRKLKIMKSRELSFEQKMNYWASVFYWYAPLKRLIYILSPIMFATFGFEVVRGTIGQVIAFWLPMYVCTAICQRLMTSNMRSNKWTAIYETALFPFLLIPVILESFGQSLQEFKVTVKTRQGNERGKNLLYMMPSLVMIALSVIGALRCLWIIMKTNSFGVAVVLFWIIYNMYVMMMSLFFTDGREAFRSTERVTVKLPCKLHIGGQTYDGVTRDISEGGMSLTLKDPVFVPLSGAVLEIKDRKYHTFLGVRPIRVGSFQRRGAKPGDRWADNQEWNYSFMITGFETEDAFDGLLGVLYDRIPTHPDHDMSSTVFNELRKNFHHRMTSSDIFARSLPRIRMESLMDVEEIREPMLLMDFNYKFFTFDPKGPLPQTATFTVAGVRMRCNRFKVTEYAALYQIESMSKVYGDQSVNDRIMRWALLHSEARIVQQKARRKPDESDLFNETDAVMNMVLEY